MSETYYPNLYNDSNVTNLQRLKIELNNKQYYEDADLEVFLVENALNPNENYDKDTNYKKLLLTVYAILESLYNNIDLYRSVETEFGTFADAVKYLEQRLQRLDRKIESIPDDLSDGDKNDVFSYIFKTNAD